MSDLRPQSDSDSPPVEPNGEGVGLVGGAVLLGRSIAGGVLMGLANIVPGVSGGTMLLASGIYPRFVEAVAEVTTFRFRRSSLIVLGVVGGFAVLAIVLGAWTIQPLMVEHRWIMYSLFIGLTLGGVPILWKMLRPSTAVTWLAATVGLIAMTGLAIVQAAGHGGQAGEAAAWPMLFVGGLAGASAMILPGISGAYLLLVLDVYLPILDGINGLRAAVTERDVEAAVAPAVGVILPVGLGVVVGVVAISNVVRTLLHRFREATLGVLLGLLVGAVVGLWPFQQAVKPAEGDVVRGQVMTAEAIAALDPQNYPTAFFTPSTAQVLLALLLILAGFALTAGLSRLSGSEPGAEG